MSDFDKASAGASRAEKPRFRWGKWLGLAFSLLFLYLAFRGLNWKALAKALAGVEIQLLLLGLIIYLASYILRGLRWRLMLLNIKPIALGKITKFLIIGFMCNNVLPARLGEFARALIIAQGEKISARSAFASVVMERVFDGVAVLALLLALLLYHPFPGWVKKMGVAAAAFFFLLFILLLFLGHKGEVWMEKLKGWSQGLPGKVAGFMLKFIYGLQMLRSLRLTLAVLFLSLLVWVMEVSNYFVLMRSLSLALPITAAAFTLVVVNLGIMIPSSPGFVGTLQYFCVLALAVYSIPKDIALAYSLILHAVIFVPITALGLIFLSQSGISLKTLKASKSLAPSQE